MECQGIFQCEMLIYIPSLFITIPHSLCFCDDADPEVLCSLSLFLHCLSLEYRRGVHQTQTTYRVHSAHSPHFTELRSHRQKSVRMILIKTRIYTIWSE